MRRHGKTKVLTVFSKVRIEISKVRIVFPKVLTVLRRQESPRCTRRTHMSLRDYIIQNYTVKWS